MRLLLIMVATLFLPIEDIHMDFNCTIPVGFYLNAPDTKKRKGKQ